MTAHAAARPQPHQRAGDAAGGITRPRRLPPGSRAVRTAARVATIAIAGTGWETAARRAANPFIPPPSAIAAWIREHWLSGPAQHLYLSDEFAHHTGASLGRMLTGWAAAAVLGIALGLLLGRSRLTHDLANPVVQFGRSIPPVTLIPAYFLLFAAGTTMQIALIITGVIWPVLLNTIAGARAIDPDLLDTVRALRIGRARRIAWVLLPAAAPAILVGLRTSLSLALILMVVSELYAATDGIGHALLAAQQAFDLPAMWAWIALLAALGNVGNAVLGALTRRALARHGNPDLTSLER